MNPKLFLLLILLIAISTIEAVPNRLVKRTTNFRKWDDRLKPLTVVTQPHDLVANQQAYFNISGNLDELTDKSKLFIEITYSDYTWDYGFSGGICNFVKGPYPPNTDFLIQTGALLKDLPTGYICIVAPFTDYDQNHDRPSARALVTQN
ncbi:14545_t:CDS:1 [Acaulospora morrowiae]|uniref:14545_t:CDS:1 n=1 Tax=Acaulospora morrowiae TaxID=94023 RepID=A0A9N9CUA8_9GLOM|nr:14545_t:CDS:1 [Acaulospora morrowiae]